MNPHTHDAVVIGGGPGGSTAATFLAKAGKKVLLLEKETFPRFHVGESLLPYNTLLFEELGVLPALEKAGFTRKFGAQFHLGNGAKHLDLVFRDGRFTKHTLAFQVERSRFDHILLEQARASGADVREGWTVSRTAQLNSSGIAVEATSPQGQANSFAASFVIDASGRSNLTGNQAGLRKVHPRLRKMAIFGHFSGVAIPSGEKAGDTIIVRLEKRWFWIIPLAPEKVSVGCVLDEKELQKSGERPEELFEKAWQSSPVLRKHLEAAQALGPIKVTTDFSYYNKRLIGPRLLRVGDAAGFMDPIFSAGVFLAMHSGKEAARLILKSLAAGDDGESRFRGYEKRFYRAMKLYWQMVEGFYTTPFMEVFLEPRHRLDLPAAVTAILAGELEGGWKLHWRLQLFYAIIRAQAWVPLLPRISFD